MEKLKDTQYFKGYVLGYRDGVRDARNGKDLENIDSQLTNLPIEAMEITTRARNCLRLAGCCSVADVLALDTSAIQTMRNLGAKSAGQIAGWLASHGLYCSAWSDYFE